MTSPEQRPRVEGEAALLTMTEDYFAWPPNFTHSSVAWYAYANALHVEVTAQRAENARLTAEVERLTKEKALASRMAFEEGAVWGFTWPTGAAIQAEAERRYPLPTPAPEATNDG